MTARHNDFAHTGPGTLAGRYLRSFWQPILRAQDLAVGRPRPVTVMSEQFTLYRGESGQVHLVGFRCPHRGTQLSTGWVEGDAIRCYYHGWKYAADGNCIEQPPEPEPFVKKVRIPTYPVQERMGLIFAYLGEGDPPPFPRFPHYEDPEQAYLNDPQAFGDYNYFQILENVPDYVHLAFVHRKTLFIYDDVEYLWIGAEERPWGVPHWGTLPNGVRTKTNAFIMPNIGWIAGGFVEVPGVEDYESMFWHVPVDDRHVYSLSVVRAKGTPDALRRLRDTFEQACAARRPAAELNAIAGRILAGDGRIDDLDVSDPDRPVLEDLVSQGGQGEIWDRTKERLGRSDVGVILLRKMWERALRQLEAGGPVRPTEQPVDWKPSRNYVAGSERLRMAATPAETEEARESPANSPGR